MRTSGRIPKRESTLLDLDSPFTKFAKAYGAATPEKAVVAACRTIRESVKQLQPPIGLREILNYLGARLERRAIWTPGRLEAEDDGYLVVVDSRQPWRRQRFTAAHEIGHIIVLEALREDQRLLQLLQDPRNLPWLERLCDRAAAEILIPEDDFRSRLREVDLNTDRGFRQLYDRYLCSRQCLLYRLTDVVPGLSASLWSEFSRKPTEPVRWRVGCCYQYPRPTWVPSGMTAEKHLFPDIVQDAASHGAARISNLVLSLSGRVCEVRASATRLDRRKNNGDCQPTFRGMEIPDEPLRQQNVVLFMWPQSRIG